MGASNQKGQVLVEAALVLSLVILIFFAAMNGLTKIKTRNHSYQFTEEVHNGKTARPKVRY